MKPAIQPRPRVVSDEMIQRPGYAYPNAYDPHPFTGTPESGASHICFHCGQGRFYFLHDEPRASEFWVRVYDLLEGGLKQ